MVIKLVVYLLNTVCDQMLDKLFKDINKQQTNIFLQMFVGVKFGHKLK
jgi:hypothetical protein